ncbi:MAG TPA: adenylate/guanylate cyclase domain-containing protein [Pirellulales bacterium]|nr:adenylate/guanylate cyclase domain-containing protein [Pirellulales bacterium]
MADLIAQGIDPQNRWRRTLPAGRAVVLGRSAGGWSAAWDDRVSRDHAEICWDGSRLRVDRLPSARNPIFVRGQPTSGFDLEPGEHFVIGQTTFTLTDERVNVSLDVPQPAQEQAFSSRYLQQIQFRHADAHIDVLSRLPEVISGATTDAELYVRLVNLVLAGVSRASAAALVAVTPAGGERPRIEVLQWDRRQLTGDDFQPSERLILEAVRRRESVLHVWNASDAASAFTIRQGVDWAYCTPIGGKACVGWGVYVSGRFSGEPGKIDTSDPTDLRDDLKFTELVAAGTGSLRDVRLLERQRAGLSQFFSPVVLEALEGRDPEIVLAPREAEATVLFCDLRGFSRHSELSADDLLGLLNRVSRALGVTTHAIREQGGVLGDFHGDAAMGFWGWPLPQPDAPLRACRAALAIRAEFGAAATKSHDPLAGFRMGIGIATGRAVAGKIGTIDQVKVTVFGPVVNLASRLEGMTKTLQAPILLDERTAAAVRAVVPTDVARLRRVAVVKPYGLDKKLEVTELLPPASVFPELSDENVADYERALDELLAGRWPQAFERLHRVPAEDRVKDFLTVFIAQHNRTPPENWNGVIPLSSK